MSTAPKPNILAPGAVATPCVPSELSAIAMAMIARASRPDDFSRSKIF
ncbi:TPA: hypothetical protein ACG69J_001156 [Streptococcus agalactiae]